MAPLLCSLIAIIKPKHFRIFHLMIIKCKFLWINFVFYAKKFGNFCLINHFSVEVGSDFTWTFRSFLCILLWKCDLWWAVILYFWLNAFPHTGHWWFFIPVCVTRCWFNCDVVLNFNGHSGHGLFRTSVWVVCRCILSEDLCTNVFSHLSHLKNFLSA